MKQTTKMSRATGQLEKMFSTLNDELFEGVLPMPILCFREAKQNRTSKKETWDCKGVPCYEIALSVKHIGCSIEDLSAELLHEMIHLYCILNAIQDTSRGGTYHNENFKEMAESYGLVCVRDEKRGWVTMASDELLEVAADHEWNEIQISHEEKAIDDTVVLEEKAVKLYEYGCPNCGPRLLASRNVGFICTCGEKLIRLRTVER